MKATEGNIPDEIAYWARDEITVRTTFDGFEIPIGEDRKVVPVYATNPKSKAQGGKHWSGQEAPVMTDANNAIPYVTIVGLERRSEGGRAYKVTLGGMAQAFYVDLREDVLLEALLVNGVKKGGELKGPFVWGTLNSQMRLVRVGSPLYAALSSSKARKAAKNIKEKDLVIGGIYMNRKLEPFLYLGPCDVSACRPWHKIEGVREVRWFKMEYHGGYDHSKPEGKPEWLTAEYWHKRWEAGYADPWPWGLLFNNVNVTKHVSTVGIDWRRLQKGAFKKGLEESDKRSLHGHPRPSDRFIDRVHEARKGGYLELASCRPKGQPEPVFTEGDLST